MSGVKYVRLTYSNGAIYGVPLSVIADDRAKYYAENDPETTYDEEFRHAMDDDYEGIDWLGNNMNMMDIKSHMVLLLPPPPFNPLEEDPVDCDIAEID